MDKKEREFPLTTQVRLRIENMNMHLCPHPTIFYKQLSIAIIGKESNDAVYQNCHSHFLLYSSLNIVVYVIEKNPNVDKALVGIKPNVRLVHSADMDFLDRSYSDDLASMVNTSHSLQLFRGGMVALILQVLPKNWAYLPCLQIVTLISNCQYWVAQIQYQRGLVSAIQKHILSDLGDIIMTYSREKEFNTYQQSAIRFAVGRRDKKLAYSYYMALCQTLSPEPLDQLVDYDFVLRVTILCNLLRSMQRKGRGIKKRETRNGVTQEGN